MSQDNLLPNCALCGIHTELKCSGCSNINYCCADHQKKHWKLHKIECRPFEIGKDDKLGRYLKATRDTSAGTLIFSEAPLVFGPKWNFDEKNEIPIFPCVGCYQTTFWGGFQCPKCEWPACRSDCAGLENPRLHGLECPILAAGKKPVNFDPKTALEYYRTDALLVLKCLLLQLKHPNKWNEILQLESHEDKGSQSPYFHEINDRIINYLQTNFISRIKIFEEKTGNKIFSSCDVAIMEKLCRIIEVNSMYIRLKNGEELSAVYQTGCLMEHSCLPNCYFTFNLTKGFRLQVRAGKTIKKGEHLSIMYTHMLWGTQMRQEHLKATKYFTCTCERCSDPTEFGTNFSALRCLGTGLTPCGGIQLPLNPLSHKTDWACNKCSVLINNSQVSHLVTQMADEVDKLLSKKETTIRELEDLIDKLSQFLHQNHYHIFALKHSLIQLYGHQDGYLPNQLSVDLLKRKIKLCHELLDIAQKLDPFALRLALYTATILYELHLALFETHKKTIVKENHTSIHDEIKEYLRLGKNILEKELDVPEGKKLYDTITIAINNVDSFFFEQI